MKLIKQYSGGCHIILGTVTQKAVIEKRLIRAIPPLAPAATHGHNNRKSRRLMALIRCRKVLQMVDELNNLKMMIKITGQAY
ncbi:hypothetical protein DVQ84_10815 [Yersinia enterocolitica]|nr:hypothetical protein [Yersinia enterocolitica]EKN6070162.1 hypothetical protein [Yersinia enterocolitica]EKN6189537.1 hypothetical protein [Yersinia enterocolitica]EKN6267257.1 hypothetical protein [Yersinia enterocolitica]EKN6337243.1 hypothetical protein [Yersinia enterocolitica]